MDNEPKRMVDHDTEEQEGLLDTTSDEKMTPKSPSNEAGGEDGLVGLQKETLKYGALFILAIQNCTFWVLSFYTRQFPPGGVQALSSTLVVVVEFVKIVICIVMVIVVSGKGFSGLMAEFDTHIVQDMGTTLKVGFPAFAYTISNNCLFMATNYMDASTAQILYTGGKLITTALCSVGILGTQLSAKKWMYLAVLAFGAIAVQMNSMGRSAGTEVATSGASTLTGLMVVVIGCVTSSAAGVYFEKVLKGSKTSVWMRNVQLGFFSCIIGLIGIYFNDFGKIQDGGFFQGYNSYTWSLVMVQAAGGLIVAFVAKYASMILKNFACTISIVFSTIIVAVYFPAHSALSQMFVVGAIMVCGATYGYGTAS